MLSRSMNHRTDSYQSIASRALGIPEILSDVLSLLQGDQTTIQTLLGCTFVNKLWNYEANKLLWQRCGVSESIDGPAPPIAALVSIHKGRRQRYADMICHLVIHQQFRHSSEESPEYYDQVHEDLRLGRCYVQRHSESDTSDEELDEYWTGIHIPQLEDMSFPLLRTLEIEGPTTEAEASRFQSRSLLQFALPTLKKLYISPGEVDCKLISEEFLERLERNCKGLVEILCPLEVVEVSLERLSLSLLSLSSVETISGCWDEIVSATTFQAMSRLPRLKELVLSFIEDEWAESLHSDTASALSFASLTSLYCSISSYGFNCMFPYLKNLRVLLLLESEDTPSLWTVFMTCNFKFLKSLELYLHKDTTIKLNDFIEVLDRIIALQTLRLSGGDITEDRPPVLNMEPLDDEAMKAIAKRLPAIKQLHLHCTSSTGKLGEDSLLSLGTNCPQLEDLCMIATIDWARFVTIAPQRLLSTLTTIRILDAPRNLDGIIGDSHRMLGKAMLLCMPSLNLWAPLEVSGDQALQHAFLEALWVRKGEREFLESSNNMRHTMRWALGQQNM